MHDSTTMDAFTKIPDSIKRKYNLTYHNVFSDFVNEELKEAESLESVINDLQQAKHNLRNSDNDFYTHPFFTESQSKIIQDYCDGSYIYLLTQKTENEATEALRASDGLLRCMVALGDEKMNPINLLDIIESAINQVREYQKEYENSHLQLK